MKCSKCGEGVYPEMDAYIISHVTIKTDDDYERNEDVACICEKCHNPI